ncbi:MAG: Na+/H+ antiporter NhaA, partial [Planctomycetaceae bacterium]|nr:Na+/H+ antiporter NhaA [Planctomycetaceae bacterium]
MRKAVNPLFGTVGGVIGPIGVFLLLNSLTGSPTWIRGWGVPTATDIALAWLVIKFLFGARHPAVSFLLLL